MDGKKVRDNIEFSEVPMPIHIPPPPSLEKFPFSVLHSLAVDTLLAHIEDLNARLKVNIKKNSFFEMQTLDREGALRAQNREIERLKFQIEEFKNKLQAESRLYKKTLKKCRDLEESLESLEARKSPPPVSHFYARYRERLRPWFKKILKERNKLLIEVNEVLEQRENTCAEFERKLQISSAKISELTKQYHDAVSNLRQKELDFKSDCSSLVENYENKIQELKQRISVLQKENKFYHNAIGEKSKNSEEVQALNNQIHILEAKLGRLNDDALSERKKNDETLSQLRKSLKSAIQKAENLSCDNSQLTQKLKVSEDGCKAKQEQFDALNQMYADSQKEKEKIKNKLENLEQLNRDLSRRLKGRSSEEVSII